MRSLRGMPGRAPLLGLRGRGPRLSLQQTIDRARRKGTFASPVGQAFGIDNEEPRIFRRIVRAEVLQKATSSRTTLISDNDPIERALLGARARKTNMYGH